MTPDQPYEITVICHPPNGVPVKSASTLPDFLKDYMMQQENIGKGIITLWPKKANADSVRSVVIANNATTSTETKKEQG